SKFPLNGSYECVYKVICVEGGADPYATGRPNPLNFSFRVPADASSEFLLQIRQRPELMNAIFDSIYPGLLSDNHLRAKPAEGLALHALGKQDLDSNNYYPKSQHYLKSPVEKLKYPQPIK
ncbi:MAG TPA: hypothetical protein VLF68_04460, partial [Candidatus Saccharimonadales bacterium]|nr:hypothetical protein [Candidatus Saccharimonadales bacterium]